MQNLFNHFMKTYFFRFRQLLTSFSVLKMANEWWIWLVYFNVWHGLIAIQVYFITAGLAMPKSSE